MPRQLRKLQAFPEMTRHFRKCVISAIACDINSTKKYIIYKFALSLLIYKSHDPWHTLYHLLGQVRWTM